MQQERQDGAGCGIVLKVILRVLALHIVVGAKALKIFEQRSDLARVALKGDDPAAVCRNA